MSDRALKDTGAASRGDGEDRARHARAKRNAWLLGGVALAFYVGYMVWFLVHGSLG